MCLWRPNPSSPQSARFMNFNSIAEWVTHKKTPPRRRTPILSRHSGGLQFCAQPFHVLVLKTEVPISIRPATRLFNRDVNIQAAGIEPHPASMAQRLRFRNLAQSQKAVVEGARRLLAVLGHRHVDVGESHVIDGSIQRTEAVFGRNLALATAAYYTFLHFAPGIPFGPHKP